MQYWMASPFSRLALAYSLPGAMIKKLFTIEFQMLDALDDRGSKLLEKSVCVHAFSFELCLETTCRPLTGPSPLISLVIDKYKEFDNNSCSLHSRIFDQCLAAVMF
jgi:hypothetical protein